MTNDAGQDGDGAAGGLKSALLRHVSVLRWLPSYSRLDALGDLVAGVTLGLTMMPQSIAYASLAGLSAEYGLYSSFMGGLVYMVFGTIKEVSIGITSLMALVTFEYTHDLPMEFVFLLTFLCGCVQLLMGLLNLGILVDFISVPVTSGFTTATSLIIIAAQLKGLLGLQGLKASNFVDNLLKVGARLGETRLWDAVLGGACIAVLLAIRKMKDLHIGPKDISCQTRTMQILNKCIWFFTISRNATVVLICSVIAFKLSSNGITPFLLSGRIQSGLPPLGPPSFSARSGNSTYSFVQMCEQLGSGIAVVPLVSVLANVAIAKAFSAGKSLDATQEMLALGLCNVFGSFVQSTPTTGAFTRSAVSHASGVRTPLAGLYSATLILLALSYLTPYFYYIPRATLSAVLISAVVFMVEYDVMVRLWSKSKRDLFALLLTLGTCLLFGVEVGLLVGALFNASQLLYFWARPAVDVRICKGRRGGEYVLVTPDIGLLYPAMDYLRTELGKVASRDAKGILPVVVNCAYFKGADYTTAQGIKLLLKDFQCYRQPLVFMGARRELLDYLQGCGLAGFQHAGSEEELPGTLQGSRQETGKLMTLDGDSLETRVLLGGETAPGPNPGRC
ncbi:sodium-independent sulfate anion transporter-like isoform X2 [Bacillus rossius redtenbacheri]|uniref:sodium-independent sulfate anion transporter-like isoform X2 n=1 Tax=Bacillus rossius redtenbacheri TaxID=93214 RepID=UPI002FDD59C8